MALEAQQLERMALHASRLEMPAMSSGATSDGGVIRYTSNDRGLEFWTISGTFGAARSFSIQTMPGLAINMTALGRMDGIEVRSGKTLSLGGKVGALVVPTTEAAHTLAHIETGPFLNARLWLGLEWLKDAATDDPAIEQLVRVAQDHLALRRLAATPSMMAAARSAATRAGPQGRLSRLHLEACAYEILVEAADQLSAFGASHGGGQLTAQRAERMEQARTILLARLEDPPSLAELARAVGTNVRRLKQDFPLMYGKPVYAFVRERRLEVTAELLIAGRCTIAQAARAAGYSHQANFAKVFRQHFGVTPRRFLKKAPY